MRREIKKRKERKVLKFICLEFAAQLPGGKNITKVLNN
jgi:hypothetical protein